MSGQHNYLCRYIIVGDSKVGKSCILLRFVDSRFVPIHDLTVGVEFANKNVELPSTLPDGGTKVLKLQIWDTAGQEQFRSIARSYYRGAVCALLVYDITERSSFEHLEDWLSEIRANGQKMVILLVGNKSDQAYRRKVSVEEGQEFARKHGLMFLETSAKEDTNIGKAFQETAKEVLRRVESGEVCIQSNGSGVKAGALEQVPEHPEKRKCC